MNNLEREVLRYVGDEKRLSQLIYDRFHERTSSHLRRVLGDFIADGLIEITRTVGTGSLGRPMNEYGITEEGVQVLKHVEAKENAKPEVDG